MMINDVLYGEGVTSNVWTFPVGFMDGTQIYKRKAYNPEMKFTTGALPTGIGKAFTTVENGELLLTCWVLNSNKVAINGEIPIMMNSTKIFDINVSSSDAPSTTPEPNISTTTVAKAKYTVGNYVLDAQVVNNLNITYNRNKFPFFQFTITLCSLRGNTFKVTQGDKIQRVVLRQWVNPVTP